MSTPDWLPRRVTSAAEAEYDAQTIMQYSTREWYVMLYLDQQARRVGFQILYHADVCQVPRVDLDALAQYGVERHTTSVITVRHHQEPWCMGTAEAWVAFRALRLGMRAAGMPIRQHLILDPDGLKWRTRIQSPLGSSGVSSAISRPSFRLKSISAVIIDSVMMASW